MSNVLAYPTDKSLERDRGRNFFMFSVYQNCIKENARFLQNLYNLTDFSFASYGIMLKISRRRKNELYCDKLWLTVDNSKKIYLKFSFVLD